MRIFIITGTYPTKMNRQAGSFIKDQAKALEQAGNEVVVLAVQGVSWRRWNEIEDGKITKTIDSNITIYDQRYLGFAQSWLPRIATFQFNKKIMNMFKIAINDTGKPDLLYAHFSFLAGFGASIISHKFNVPLMVLEHHSLFLKKRISSYIIEILKQTIEYSDKFMSVSQSLKKSIINLTSTSKPISVLPNMIGSHFIFKPRIRKNEFVFFSAGNLVKGKAFDVLINSFIKEFSKTESVKLIIGGDGPERPKLLNLIKAHDRDNQIELLGRLDRNNMIKKYEQCDCFILVSRRETFGIVYREAMAVGRPVISTKNGGIDEAWDPICGLLTEIDDTHCICNAMREMRDTIDSYDGKLISKYILEKYSRDAILNQLEEEIKKINILP